MNESDNRAPYPLPTWNRILAMHPWQRKQLRDLLHLSISGLSVIERQTTTQTEYRLKPYWTALLELEYLQMIRPSKSNKSRLKAKKVKKKRRSSK